MHDACMVRYVDLIPQCASSRRCHRIQNQTSISLTKPKAKRHVHATVTAKPMPTIIGGKIRWIIRAFATVLTS